MAGGGDGAGADDGAAAVAGGRRNACGRAGRGGGDDGAGGAVGARGARGGEQRVGGLDRLQGVNIAVAGIDILGGHDDRERCVVVARGGDGGVAGGIVPLADLALHCGNGIGDGLAGDHGVEEGSLPLIIVCKADGLGVAVDDLDALLAQRLLQAVGRHTEANCHPEQAVGGGFGHVVGDGGAVDLVVLHRAVGAGVVGVVVGVVGGGDAGAALQAQVRGGRGVVVAVGVVGAAVAVEDDDGAVHQRVGDVVDRRVGGLIEGVGAAERGGKLLGLGLVLGGEAGIDAVVRLDQVDVLAGGGAALDLIGDRLNERIVGLAVGLVDLPGASLVAELRGIVTGDALVRHPGEAVAVALEGAFDVVLGCLDDGDGAFDGLRARCSHRV